MWTSVQGPPLLAHRTADECDRRAVGLGFAAGQHGTGVTLLGRREVHALARREPSLAAKRFGRGLTVRRSVRRQFAALAAIAGGAAAQITSTPHNLSTGGTGANHVTGTDAGCLFHLGGLRRRGGRGPRAIHLAEILARGSGA